MSVLHVPVCINGNNYSTGGIPTNLPTDLRLEERELFINQETNTLFVGNQDNEVVPVSVCRFNSYFDTNDKITGVKEMSTSAFYVDSKDEEMSGKGKMVFRPEATLEGYGDDGAQYPYIEKFQIQHCFIQSNDLHSCSIYDDCDFPGSYYTFGEDANSAIAFKGAIILNAGVSYGNELPTSAQEGQLFFLKVNTN